MNSLTITPNSDDSQADNDDRKRKRPVSAVSEALVSLVERAKNLNFDIRSQSLNLTRSCPTISRCKSLATASKGSTTTITTSTTNTATSKKQISGSGRILPIKSKARGFTGATGCGRNVAAPPITTTLRKLRKTDSQSGHGSVATVLQTQPPPPPPPSPRSPQSREIFLAVELADALKDEYKRTEALTNNIFQEAVSINEELAQQWQHQRDVELVHQIEMAAESHGLNLLLAENELTELKRRCLKTLDQVSKCHTPPVPNLSQGTQTVDSQCNCFSIPKLSGWNKDSQLGTAMSEKRKLTIIGDEHEQIAFAYTKSYEPIFLITELKKRMKEIRRLMALKAEGTCCDERLRKISFQCQRNAAFYQVMASVENDLIDILPEYSSIAPQPVQYDDQTIEPQISLHKK